MATEHDEGQRPATSADAGATVEDDGTATSYEAGAALLELVLDDPVRYPPPARIDGVVVGRVVGRNVRGEPLVDFPERAVPVAGERDPGIGARALCAVNEGDVGREAALLFEGGDPARPVVMGLMYARPASEVAEGPLRDLRSPLTLGDRGPAPQEQAPKPEVTSDGTRLLFEAEREIILRCGAASITLTRAGKILLKGCYLLARSSGVNRIVGGSVQIN